MASDGDTIVYNTGGSRVSEDISTIDEITVHYLDGPGGDSGGQNGGAGGRVSGATIDTTGETTLYIWTGSQPGGRYSGTDPNGVDVHGGGSAELSFNGDDEASGPDLPFLVGAGGGGGGAKVTQNTVTGGGDGARTDPNAPTNSGTPPPEGGVSNGVNDGGDGSAATDDQTRGLVTGATLTTGGGASQDTDGEAKISYTNKAPTAPSGLAASLTTADDVSLSWTDNSTTEDEFRVYRTSVAAPSFPADYSQIATVGQTVTSYTDISPPTGVSLTYAVTAANTTYGESSETTAAITTPVLGTVEWTPAVGTASIEESATGGASIEEPAAGGAAIEQPATGDADIEESAAGEANIEQPATGDADIEESAPGDTDDND